LSLLGALQVLRNIGILSRKGERMPWFRRLRERNRTGSSSGTELRYSSIAFGSFDTSVTMTSSKRRDNYCVAGQTA